jgi:hypothetical protein
MPLIGRATISNLPDDIRHLLARSMRQPLRCGGTFYVDGKRYLRVGGRLLTPEEFRKLEDSKQELLTDEEIKRIRIWLSGGSPP